jgi:putative two-component system response regulator
MRTAAFRMNRKYLEEQTLDAKNCAMSDQNESVLVVDDDPYVLESIASLLSHFGYSVVTSNSAETAMRAVQSKPVQVVLTDIKMPVVTGVELLGNIHAYDPQIPVILMTAYAELEVAVDAIKKGAFDFITKPYNADYLLHTIEKAVKYTELIRMERDYKKTLEETVRTRTRELSDALEMAKSVSRELISRLTVVAEYRDTDTGEHINRIGLYSKKIAEQLQLAPDFVDALTFASSMHDIGKIGIPDNILLKQGPLTRDEFEVMKTHASMGEKILAGSSYPSIQLAASVALNHHERFDGGGYPRGLRGTDIPIEGRIVMLADQYDALRSVRPYKKALSHAETFDIIVHGDERTKTSHFDPDVLSVFRRIAPAMNDIFEQYSS